MEFRGLVNCSSIIRGYFIRSDPRGEFVDYQFWDILISIVTIISILKNQYSCNNNCFRWSEKFLPFKKFSNGYVEIFIHINKENNRSEFSMLVYFYIDF